MTRPITAFIAASHSTKIYRKICLSFLLSLTILVGAQHSFAIDPAEALETHKSILSSIESTDESTAIASLIDLKAKDAKHFEINNYDYLLGRLAERNGQVAVAVESYSAVAERDSILRAYALFHLAGIFRSSGNLMLERVYLQRLSLLAPNSMLINATRIRLAKSAYEAENFALTMQLLASGKPNGKEDASPSAVRYLRDDKVLFALATMRDGKIDFARTMLSELIAQTPNLEQSDDAALMSVTALDALDAGPDAEANAVGELTEAEHLMRAKIYQFNREFEHAQAHFDAVIARFPGSVSAPDAMMQIGRGFSQQQKHVEALNWYERVQERYPDSVSAKEGLLQSAAAYSRVGKPKEALTRYQRYIDKFPTDEKLDRAYLNAVDVLRDQGDTNDSLKWTAKTRDVFKGKPAELLATFAETKIYISKSDWANAIVAIDKLMSVPELGLANLPGGTDVVELKFLKALALEKQNKFAEAIELFLSIPDGRNEYYGWRASERLRAMQSNDGAASHIAQAAGNLAATLNSKDPEERRQSAIKLLRFSSNETLRTKAIEFLAASKSSSKVAELPNIRANSLPIRLPLTSVKTGVKGWDELLFLGLYDEAVAQLDAEKAVKGTSTDMTDLYRRGNRADKVMLVAEPLWKKVPADYPIELLPRDQLAVLYPTPFAHELRQFASQKNVDPRLMLAIMRQESRFTADIKSYAAARGLMQFIAPTAKKLAAELGRNGVRQDDLYDPTTSIEFGSQYLADLFKIFPGQPDAVAASYNGGEESVKRWIARSGTSQSDLYVSELVFSQTKDYVYKVMANYRMYCHIYDENLRPR